MDRVCYVTPEWDPRIRPASLKRGWMEPTPEADAYRCLPLNVANSHGWEVLSPCSFAAMWDGGPAASSLHIDLSQASNAWAKASNPFFAGDNAWWLGFVPFIILCVVLYLVGREKIMRGTADSAGDASAAVEARESDL